jgi:hypothetical protein
MVKWSGLGCFLGGGSAGRTPAAIGMARARPSWAGCRVVYGTRATQLRLRIGCYSSSGRADPQGRIARRWLPGPHGLELHDVVEEQPGVLAVVSMLALALVFIASILRQGPRGFIGQIVQPQHEDHHGASGCDTDCRDACGHGHDPKAHGDGDSGTDGDDGDAKGDEPDDLRAH